MKKTSYYIALIVVGGFLIISFWVWQQYFRKSAETYLTFPVELGNIEELVRARGEVVAQKEFELSFPFAGTITEIFVKEGDEVKNGAPLVKLDTIDSELELQELGALRAQREANLRKLVEGATPEDLAISETKVENAKVALGDARQNLVDKLQDAYTKSDDAIRNKTDQLFSNPRTASPSMIFSELDSKLRGDIEWQRTVIETTLISWRVSLGSLSVNSDPVAYMGQAEGALAQVRAFLDAIAAVVNSITKSSSFSQTVIDAYRVDVAAARTNVNTASTNLSAAEEKYSTANSSVTLAEKELAFKQAGTRTEDIKIAQAQIQATNSQIGIIREKIRKATIAAPGAGRVAKLYFEKHEVVSSGVIVALFSTLEHKIQADISELEIGKLRAGAENKVFIKLDAFSDVEFSGSVVSVDPKEVIKNGDKYYRINVHFDAHGMEVRSGMSADLAILISSKQGVARVPALAVYSRGDKKYVKVFDAGRVREVEVTLGISDGTNVEVVSGLSAGEVAAISK